MRTRRNVALAAIFLLLPAIAWAKGPASGAPLPSKGSPRPIEPALTLHTVGELAQAYVLPADFLRRLEKGLPNLTEGTLLQQYLKMTGAAQPETLQLPKPLYSLPLPGTATSLILPTTRHPETLVATHNGLVEVVTWPKPAVRVLLPDLNIAMAKRAEDGTVYMLLKTWIPPVIDKQTHPAPILSWKPGSKQPPDTVAVAGPGACTLHLMPGDTLLWVPRLVDRKLDRVALRGNRWVLQETHLSHLGEPFAEFLSRLWWVYIPPGGDPLILDQARGHSPRLLSLKPDGSVALVGKWNRGIQAADASIAWGAGLCITAEYEDIAVLRIKDSDQMDIGSIDPTSAITLSDDGRWMAAARPPEGSERTRIEFGRLFSNRIAIAWADGGVTHVELSEPAAARKQP